MKTMLCAVAFVLLAVPAGAQESGQTGLAVGFPGSIGLVWHASDRFAVRPDFTFTRTHGETGETSTLETDAWGIGFGVSALIYTGKVTGNVRTYFSPRFGYARTHTENTANPSVYSTTQHSNTYTYSGAFGAQYSPSRKFAVYGEAGISYSTGDSDVSYSGEIFIDASRTSTSWTLGSRAGVGVIFYFD